jgi:hypothetical protein
MVRPLPRHADPLPAGARASHAPASLPPVGAMVAGPAGPARGLGAGRGCVGPRNIRHRDRLDVPPSRHRAGACGMAGAIPRYRNVWRQPEGLPCRGSGPQAGMVGEPGRCAGHGPRFRRGRRGNRIAPSAAGCRARCSPCARHHAIRSHARKVAHVMVGRISTTRSCPCRPRSFNRAARLPGTAKFDISDERGRRTASPAVPIRADLESRDPARATTNRYTVCG